MNNYERQIIIDEINKLNESKKNNLPYNKYELINKFKKCYSNLEERQIEQIIDLILESNQKKEVEHIDLAVTIPYTFQSNSIPTSIAMKEIISKAKKQILITGYSISDYFDDLINILIDKISHGVQVKLYLNDFKSKKEILDKLLIYKGKFLEIYDYNKNPDGCDALHAKVISCDNKFSLITSANLSFNGLEKNIEIGTIIDSQIIASKLIDIFALLYRNHTFIKI